MSEVKFKSYFIFILGILAMLPPLAIDMYLPSFLDISRELNVPQESVQTTLALFTFGFAFGQLFWGPLADSFGRKPIIVLGLLGSALMSLLITQTNDIATFDIFRLIQGLCASAPAVVLGALVKDLFDRNRFVKIMSMIMMVSMLAPMLAPMLGGYLAKWFHWHSIFIALLIMGIISAVLVLWQIPETLKEENKAELSFKGVIKNFSAVISHKETLGYVLVGGISFAGMFSFISSGSLVYIGFFNVAPENFGYFFILNMIAMMVMTFINGRFVSKFGSERMLKFGLLIQLIAGVWLVICGVFHLGLWPMAIGISLFIGMNSTVGSNANAAILDLYPKMAGTANAVAGVARFGLASLITMILSNIPLTSERPMLYAMACCIVLCWLCYYLLCARKA